ncbi:hypothetical protein TNCV_3314571 [Trichonephila clavipes]|nr:hypothetical protein TNCV_3314571 [Trichonephila clavipes]
MVTAVVEWQWSQTCGQHCRVVGSSPSATEDPSCEAADACSMCQDSKYFHWWGRAFIKINGLISFFLNGRTLKNVRAIGSGPRNFQHWSSNEDDTSAGTPLSNQ